MTRTTAQSGIIAWFVQNPVAANLLMLVILVAGFMTALGLRIEGFPSLDPSRITVDVTYESGDAHQAEEGIAIRIEEALQGISGIKSISSVSTAKGATVEITRTSNYDPDRLNTDVKNQVDGIFGFPEAAEKPVVAQQQREQEVLWLSVYGDVDQKTLQDVARQFENTLLALPSIKRIVRSGRKRPEIAIEVDEKMLQAHDLTLDELAQRIRDESLSRTSGELRSDAGILFLKADRQSYSYRDFADIVIMTNRDGSHLRLKDIATVIDGYRETPNVLSRFQGKPAINLEVRTNHDGNIVDMAEEAERLVRQWQTNDQLPQGLEIEMWWDQSTNMVERLNLILENGLIGILLVMLVLSIFLNFRVAFWVGVGLPVCFAGGLILMSSNFFDLSLNQLTTFGFILVLGILVDDAVIVGESIYTARRQLGDSTGSTIIGVKRVAIPTICGVLTTVAAFYPMSLIAGQLGSLFSQFALVCTGCLLFSLLESKLILPAHLASLKTGREAGRSRPGQIFSQVQQMADRALHNFRHQVYRPLITFALHHRYAVFCLFISIFVLVTGMLPSGKVKFDFFPDVPEETVSIHYSIETGTGYGIAHQQADRIEQVVRRLNQQWREQYPDSDDVMARIYTVVSDDINGQVSIELSPAEQRVLDSTAVADALREALPKTEGLKQLIVSTDNFDDKDFVLNLLSDDPGKLEDAADQIMRVLISIQGIRDIENSLYAGQLQLIFELTPEGRALAMTTENLARQIQQSFYGAEVQRVQRGKDEVRVWVRYPAHERRDITDLQNARVRTPGGDIVPLSTVAFLQQEYTITDINRINGYRAATLSANVEETLMESEDVIEFLESSILPEIRAKYPQMQILSEGEDVEKEEAMQSMKIIFMFSLMSIYILIAVPLKSYWQPLIIMSAIPFGIVIDVDGPGHPGRQAGWI